MKVGKDCIGIGCGAMIIDDSGSKTFLLKRSKNSKGGVGEWNRPGGTIEFGEKVEEAVKREVMEEAGIDIEIIRFLGYTDHLFTGQHWISLGFLAKIKEGIPVNAEPDKHDEAGWFELNQLPENLAKPTKEGVEEYLRIRNEGRI